MSVLFSHGQAILVDFAESCCGESEVDVCGAVVWIFLLVLSFARTSQAEGEGGGGKRCEWGWPMGDGLRLGVGRWEVEMASGGWNGERVLGRGEG